jgi:hypothetical protein
MKVKIERAGWRQRLRTFGDGRGAFLRAHGIQPATGLTAGRKVGVFCSGCVLISSLLAGCSSVRWSYDEPEVVKRERLRESQPTLYEIERHRQQEEATRFQPAER